MKTFVEILDALLDGKRVTREDWGDKRTYYLIHDNLISIHKAGEAEETIKPVVLSDIDFVADDWTIL